MAKKKAARVILGTVGVLTILGLSATVAYYANSSVKDWVDSEWSKLTDHDSTEKGFVEEEVTSPDGLMHVTIYSNQLQMAHAKSVDSTKTAVATLNSESTDKRVKWTTADSTKVAVGSTYTNSGEAVTLTCKSIFEGSVAVTATAVSDSSISCVYNCYVNNGVGDYFIDGIGIVKTKTASDQNFEAFGNIAGMSDNTATAVSGDSYFSCDTTGHYFKYNLQPGEQAVVFFVVKGESGALPIDVFDPDDFESDGTQQGDIGVDSAGVLQFSTRSFNPLAEAGYNLGVLTSMYEGNDSLRLAWFALNDANSTARSSVDGSISTAESDGYIASDYVFHTESFIKATSVTGGGDITF